MSGKPAVEMQGKQHRFTGIEKYWIQKEENGEEWRTWME